MTHLTLSGALEMTHTMLRCLAN